MKLPRLPTNVDKEFLERSALWSAVLAHHGKELPRKVEPSAEVLKLTHRQMSDLCALVDVRLELAPCGLF